MTKTKNKSIMKKSQSQDLIRIIITAKYVMKTTKTFYYI